MSDHQGPNPYDQEATAAAANNVPPHSLQLERAVIGLMLLGAESLDEVIAADLRSEFFYAPLHQHLYSTICQLHSTAHAVDVITVAEALGPEMLEMAGGRSGLVEIQGAAGFATSVATYSELLRKYRTLRSLIGAAHELRDLGYEQILTDITSTLDAAERALFEVTDEYRGATSRGVQSPRQLLGEYLDILEERCASEDAITGLPTGWIDYDAITMGWRPDSLNVVAGRPGSGKSSFAVGAAAQNALVFGKTVLYFSLEMTANDLLERVMSSHARIDGSRLKRGELNDANWAKIGESVGVLAEAPLLIDDTPLMTLMELRAKARRVKATSGGELGLIVVDYLQLMSSHHEGRRGPENRQVEVSELSRGLKLLARELMTPVLALSQLSRGVEMRQDKRPMLADLRESGAIENDADTVTMIFREEMYEPDNLDARGKAEAIVAKNRHGQTGTAHLQWEAPLTRFGNLAASHVAPPPDPVQGSFGQ